MATREGASIVKWSKVLGSLEPGKRGDLLVIGGINKDPYATLIEAAESEIELVVIQGRRHYGLKKQMGGIPAAKTESLKVDGQQRVLYLDTPESTFASMPKLSEAQEELADLPNNLPERAKERIASAMPHRMAAPTIDSRGDVAGGFTLAVDEIEDTGVQIRPHLLDRRHKLTGPRTTAPVTAAEATAAVLPVIALELDPLTVADDSKFLSIRERRDEPSCRLRKDRCETILVPSR